MRPFLPVAVALAALTATSAVAEPAARPRLACAAEIQKFCPDFQPGGGHLMQCLKPHRSELSTTCTSAIQAARAARLERKQATPPAATAAAPQG